MKVGRYLLVFVCALTVVVCDNDNKVEIALPPQPPAPKTSTEKPTSTTPKPSPPTTPPSPPTPSPSPPTPPPSPPTPKPTPPSPPTSSTSPPTSSTSPPTSSTSPHTTTSPHTPPTSPRTPPTSPPTPKPTPKPVNPESGKWFLNYTGTNVTCLLVNAAIQITVPYVDKYNSTLEAFVNVPSNATASGDCSQSPQIILMTWKETNNTNVVSLEFDKNSTTKKYYIRNIEISLPRDGQHFPNAKDNTTLHLNHTQKEFETTVDKSYKCLKEQKLNLTDSTLKPGGAIHFSNFQFEAYHNSTNMQFESAEDCAPFDTPDIVPIAVGCALAALVIIVLIAYLVGRRRRQARGYLSM